MDKVICPGFLFSSWDAWGGLTQKNRRMGTDEQEKDGAKHPPLQGVSLNT